MKKIKIPSLLQKLNSNDCGPACVQMVLQYFGINKDFDELRSNLNFYENGTTAYDNGSLLLGAGLKVTAITAQPYLFSPETICHLRTKEAVISTIELTQVQMPKFKTNLDTFKKFLNDGGNLKIEIPAFKHIKESIDSGNPVIALMYARAMGVMEGGFHFVVVSGYREGEVFINNPSPRSSRQAWFPVENFLYAVHSSTTYDIDNGTLLVVSK